PPAATPSPPQGQTKLRLSRRAVAAGIVLAGVALVEGGLLWLKSTPKPQATATPTVFSALPIGTPLVIYHHHILPVYALTWAPDGKRIASGSQDGTIQVWDTTSGKQYVIYRGHRGSVNAVAWSPDGRLIAS